MTGRWGLTVRGAESSKPDKDAELLDLTIQAIDTNTKASPLISLVEFVKSYK
jgi:hypothetical protein